MAPHRGFSQRNMEGRPLINADAFRGRIEDFRAASSELRCLMEDEVHPGRVDSACMNRQRLG